MAAHVRIPTPLRRLTKGERVIEVSGGDLGQVIDELEQRYPGIREKLVDERGDVLRFVNIFVNEQDIRFLAGLKTPLGAGAEVSIVPAMAGGAG
ncbi:MAG TPA: MoaD/ThiS family protein [bacterium]|nr:MoaD/ThiS family protein [bacterium]